HATSTRAIYPLSLHDALPICTIRWRALLDVDRPPPFYPTFFALTTGYMLSTVLPIRAGDVARPALLARRTDIRFATALGTVLTRSEEHTSELQSLAYLVCRLL